VGPLSRCCPQVPVATDYAGGYGSLPPKPGRTMLTYPPSFVTRLACLLSLALPVAARAADDLADPLADPPGLASFTRAIQPLLLNRCAAGACHGSPEAAHLQLTRGPTRGRADRLTTLRNLQQVSDAVAHRGGDQSFLQTVLRQHPPAMLPGRPAAGLLTVHERQLLATWLAAFMPPASDGPADSVQEADSQRVTPAAFDQPARRSLLQPLPTGPMGPGPTAANASSTERPNRFRQLLEQAANPPQLPPPRVTKPLQLERVLPDNFPPLPPADDAASE